MHRARWFRLATTFMRLPIVVVMGRLMSLVLILLGFVLVWKGGNEAHVLNGLGLNLNWKESSGEAKLIFGFGVLVIAWAEMNARRTYSRRLRARSDSRP